MRWSRLPARRGDHSAPGDAFQRRLGGHNGSVDRTITREGVSRAGAGIVARHGAALLRRRPAGARCARAVPPPRSLRPGVVFTHDHEPEAPRSGGHPYYVTTCPTCVCLPVGQRASAPADRPACAHDGRDDRRSPGPAPVGPPDRAGGSQRRDARRARRPGGARHRLRDGAGPPSPQRAGRPRRDPAVLDRSPHGPREPLVRPPRSQHDPAGHLIGRGYRFVSLEKALEDEAWRTPDLFVGTNGPSWLHRFSLALDRPMRLKDEPDPPDWVIEAYRALR